jgi:hypothetical protein
VAFEEIRKETKKGAMPFKMEKFINGMLEIDPKLDYGTKRGKGAGIIKRLDAHKSNRASGGTEFWKLDQNAIDVMEMSGGKLVAREPVGGVTSELFDQLQKLYGNINGYKSDDHKAVVEEICGLFDIFSVLGLPKPSPDYDQMRVKGRMIEFFSILKEREIWEALEA